MCLTYISYFLIFAQSTVALLDNLRDHFLLSVISPLHGAPTQSPERVFLTRNISASPLKELLGFSGTSFFRRNAVPLVSPRDLFTISGVRFHQSHRSSGLSVLWGLGGTIRDGYFSAERRSARLSAELVHYIRSEVPPEPSLRRPLRSMGTRRHHPGRVFFGGTPFRSSLRSAELRTLYPEFASISLESPPIAAPRKGGGLLTTLNSGGDTVPPPLRSHLTADLRTL